MTLEQYIDNSGIFTLAGDWNSRAIAKTYSNATKNQDLDPFSQERKVTDKEPVEAKQNKPEESDVYGF